MRNPFVFVFTLFKKLIALMLLSVLTVFYYVYSIVLFCYRYIAVAFAVVGTIMVVVDSFVYGFTAERGMILLCLAGAIVLRYLLSLLVPVMQRWQEELTEYLYEPMTIRSPVRYTI